MMMFSNHLCLKNNCFLLSNLNVEFLLLINHFEGRSSVLLMIRFRAFFTIAGCDG